MLLMRFSTLIFEFDCIFYLFIDSILYQSKVAFPNAEVDLIFIEGYFMMDLPFLILSSLILAQLLLNA